MGLEDDFLKQDADDEKTIEYIKNYLPQELKEKFSDDEFYYFLDLIDEYYSESGILDATPDDEGYIDIDLEKVVDYIVKEARKDEMGEYDPEEILFIGIGKIDPVVYILDHDCSLWFEDTAQFPQQAADGLQMQEQHGYVDHVKLFYPLCFHNVCQAVGKSWIFNIRLIEPHML